MTTSFNKAIFAALFLVAVVACHAPWAIAAEGEKSGEKACETELVLPAAPALSGEEFKKSSAYRARIFNRIESTSGKWLAWHQQDQKTLLAALDGANFLKVYEPTKNDDAIFSLRWSSPDGQTRPFTRAEWLNAGPGAAMILAGDTRGNLLTFEPLHYPDAAARFQGSKVPVEPHVVATEDNRYLAALGLLDLSRVRIVPVGSWNEVHDIHLGASILSMAAHRTPFGESLLAVTTESAVEVFKLHSGGSERILVFSRHGSSLNPRWVESESGESVLVVVDADSKLNVLFPETKATPLTTEVLGSSTEALQVSRGALGVWILVKACASCEPRVFQLQGKELSELKDLPSNADEGDESFIFAGLNKEPLMVSTQTVDEQKVVILTDLANPASPTVSIPIDSSSEIVKGFSSVETERGRALLAIQTTAKIYTVELSARR